MLLSKLFPDLHARRRGRAGENRIESSLGWLSFWGFKGLCLRNVYVPRSDGSTSEIDLIYVTQKGLFVIESKNYIGYIFGNERNQNWVSTVYAGKTWYGRKKIDKNHFYNPIWQNKSHITALRNYCGNIKTFSIIAFGNNCELKDVTWTSPDVSVCQYYKLNRTIKQIWNCSPNIYSEAEVQNIYNSLSALNSSKEVQANHIMQLHQEHSYSKPSICPRCGGALVLRTAKRGPNIGSSFYGCSNYPRCTFTRNA
jgi:hypothetical protein